MDFGVAADFLRHHQVLVLACTSALALVLLVVNALLTHRVRSLSRKALGVVDGETGRSLKQELGELTKGLSAASSGLEEALRRQEELKAQLDLCLQRVGFVRFNAFEDVGGEQSFALALLDANENGVVLSNLLSRVDSRAYAKAIGAGSSEHTLSEEEKEAVRKATRR